MATYSFTNSTGLAIPDEDTVSQTIAALGIGAPISSVGITLRFGSNYYVPDLDMLLVDPTGSVGYEFFSDVRNGGGGPLVLAISDQATDLLRDVNGVVTSTGAYRPADHGTGSNPNETWVGSADVVLSAGPAGETSFADAFGGLPANGSWTLFVADDSGLDTNSILSWTLSIVTNEARALTDVATSLSVTEGDAPTLLDGDVTFNVDVDEFEDGKLVVSGLLAGDVVAIRHEGTGDGEIGFDGGIVTYSGIAFATATGGSGADLVVTFDADADAEAIEALIENLTYRNTSNSPTAQRTLQVTVTDAFGGETSIWRPGYSGIPDAPNPFAGLNVGAVARPAVADIDGDGDLDVVFGSYVSGFVTYLQNDDGEFVASAPEQDPLAGIGTVGFATAALADMDGDGDIDLTLGGLNGTLAVYLQDPNGDFATAPVNPFAGIDVGAISAPALGDLDGDGDLDLVVGNADGGVFLYRQDENGAFLLDDTTALSAVSLQDTVVPALADLDGDGDMDVILGDGLTPRVLLQQADGTFVEQTGDDNPFRDVLYQGDIAPALGDLDGDGFLDLVLGQGGGGVAVYSAAPSFGITVNVTAVNDAPVLTGDLAATVLEGGSVTLTAADLGFTDPDDNAAGVTFTVSSLANGKIEVNGTTSTIFTGQQLADGLVAFVHDASQTSVASFQVSVEDGNEDVSTPVAQTFSITVTPVDQPPSAPVDIDGETGGSVAENAAVGTAVGIMAYAADPDSAVVYSLADDAGGRFAIDAATGVVTVAGLLDFEAAQNHTIAVVATGGGVASAPVEFVIAVTDVNEAPTGLVVSPPAAVPENEPVMAGTLLATYSYQDDALGTEVVSLSGVDASLFYAVGGQVLWRDGITPDFEEQDAFRFTLSLTDGDGLGISAEVLVEVENRAVTNVLVASGGSISEAAVAGTVAARFDAFEGGTAEPQAFFTLVDDAGGRFVLSGNELLLASGADLDFEADESHSVTIRSGDGSGPAVERTFVIAVTDVAGRSFAGSGEAEEIAGTAEADDLSGAGGDDTFAGSDGADTISGGDGLDRVVYAGPRDEYQQDLLPDGSILVTKPDGSTDTLSGIERIEFEDGAFIFDLDGDSAPFGYLLYQAAYDRVPDEAGLRFWTGILDQLEDTLGEDGAALAVAAYFLDADEFEENYGASPSDEDFVAALYENALGRASDDAGADFWTDALEDGLSREAALIAFAASAENVANNAQNIDDGFWVG